MTALARNTDPDTSHAAAATIRESRSAALRRVILNLFRDHGPMTDHDVAFRYDCLPGASDVSDSGLRTRRAELVADGALVDTGRREPSPTSGRAAIVWGIAA